MAGSRKIERTPVEATAPPQPAVLPEDLLRALQSTLAEQLQATRALLGVTLRVAELLGAQHKYINAGMPLPDPQQVVAKAQQILAGAEPTKEAP